MSQKSYEPLKKQTFLTPYLSKVENLIIVSTTARRRVADEKKKKETAEKRASLRKRRRARRALVQWERDVSQDRDSRRTGGCINALARLLMCRLCNFYATRARVHAAHARSAKIMTGLLLGACNKALFEAPRASCVYIFPLCVHGAFRVDCRWWALIDGWARMGHERWFPFFLVALWGVEWWEGRVDGRNEWYSF